mmetsp:Transcript_52317/g.136229  ORF Transcript_52317/g.136229 Transcript_52317/m.136229 type:complete len:308 (-) Transcript_52317:25-948(-)
MPLMRPTSDHTCGFSTWCSVTFCRYSVHSLAAPLIMMTPSSWNCCTCCSVRCSCWGAWPATTPAGSGTWGSCMPTCSLETLIALSAMELPEAEDGMGSAIRRMPSMLATPIRAVSRAFTMVMSEIPCEPMVTVSWESLSLDRPTAWPVSRIWACRPAKASMARRPFSSSRYCRSASFSSSSDFHASPATTWSEIIFQPRTASRPVMSCRKRRPMPWSRAGFGIESASTVPSASTTKVASIATRPCMISASRYQRILLNPTLKLLRTSSTYFPWYWENPRGSKVTSLGSQPRGLYPGCFHGSAHRLST